MFVTYGRTESGDDLTPIVWQSTLPPTNEDVEKIYRRLYEEEYEEVGFVLHYT
jgi:hypothetical protein